MCLWEEYDEPETEGHNPSGEVPTEGMGRTETLGRGPDTEISTRVQGCGRRSDGRVYLQKE